MIDRFSFRRRICHPCLNERPTSYQSKQGQCAGGLILTFIFIREQVLLRFIHVRSWRFKSWKKPFLGDDFNLCSDKFSVSAASPGCHWSWGWGTVLHVLIQLVQYCWRIRKCFAVNSILSDQLDHLKIADNIGLKVKINLPWFSNIRFSTVYLASRIPSHVFM